MAEDAAEFGELKSSPLLFVAKENTEAANEIALNPVL